MPQLHLDRLVFLGILCASAHWIVARSEVARPIWSRARGFFDLLLRCAGCSGFWLGALCGVCGLRPITGFWILFEVVVAGLLAVFVTPVCEAVLLHALAMCHLHDGEDENQDPELGR